MLSRSIFAPYTGLYCLYGVVLLEVSVRLSEALANLLDDDEDCHTVSGSSSFQ